MIFQYYENLKESLKDHDIDKKEGGKLDKIWHYYIYRKEGNRKSAPQANVKDIFGTLTSGAFGLDRG